MTDKSSQTKVERMVSICLGEGSQPIVHPNGFIQLHYREQRMHFWSRSIPRQETASPNHDHIFDMHSKILLGELSHTEVTAILEKDGYYDVCIAIATRDAETELLPNGQRVRIEHGPRQVFTAGQSYDFPAFHFHVTSDIHPAVSIITKGATHIGSPRVLVPHGQEPDNDFVRDEFNQEELEIMIFDVIKEAA